MAGVLKHKQRSRRSHKNHQMMAGSFARTSAATATMKQAKKTQGILEGLKNLVTHNTANK